MDMNTEFMDAVERYEAMQATLGDEHPLTRQAMALCMELAPQELKTIMAEKAREIGLMPERPHGYTSEGEACYRLEDIAKRLGMAEDEVQESVKAFLADRAALGLDSGLVDPYTIHRVQ